MAIEFRLPDLGEGIHEGEVLAVKVKAGQQVNEDDTLLEVETDKAAVEIPSPYTDIVSAVRVAPGDTVHVDDVLIVFGSDGVATPVGDAGTATASRTSQPTASPPEALADGPRRQGPVPAAPSTRRLARELGVDLHKVNPTGPGGRVTREDVRAHGEGKSAVGSAEPEPTQSAATSGDAETVPTALSAVRFDESTSRTERIPLRSIRRATARQMASSWSQVPHVSTQDLVDITELEKLRLRHKDEVKARGGALTLTVFVIRALVNALREFPTFNASIDMSAEEVVLKHFHNVGIAVDTDRGLLVPVIRDADAKIALDLAVELRELATRAREGKATLADLQGGTITITNVGAIGGTGFAPIINHPEVAILGLAQARVQPVAVVRELDEGEAVAWEDQYEFVPRLMLPIVLSFDHRVNDGALAQRFLNRIIEQLEAPERLLLGL